MKKIDFKPKEMLEIDLAKLNSKENLQKYVWEPINNKVSSRLNIQNGCEDGIHVNELINIHITYKKKQGLYVDVLLDPCNSYIVGFGSQDTNNQFYIAEDLNDVRYREIADICFDFPKDLFECIFMNAQETIKAGNANQIDIDKPYFYFFTYLLCESVKSDPVRIGIELYLSLKAKKNSSAELNQILKDHVIYLTNPNVMVNYLIYKNYFVYFLCWKKVASLKNNFGDVCKIDDYRIYYNHSQDARLIDMGIV